MRFTFTALFVAVFGQTVLAGPLLTDISTLARAPTSELNTFGVHSNVTLGGRGDVRHDVAGATFPANLLVCAEANCAGACNAFDLSKIPEDVCLGTNQFFSAGISQPSNSGLPFAVTVGTLGCDSLVQLPSVNTCFNLNGGSFATFELLP
ncbi:hypothetical protein C8Q79DRAFT_928034 [Trametes meyenii]|nr:hypothetical protein C8Q79DRAFT_928034 [Trametes meyenii]